MTENNCPLFSVVTKKIAHERLTALVFRDECIVTACQVCLCSLSQFEFEYNISWKFEGWLRLHMGTSRPGSWHCWRLWVARWFPGVATFLSEKKLHRLQLPERVSYGSWPTICCENVVTPIYVVLTNFRLAPSRVRLLHHRMWYTPWCDHIWVWWWDAVIWAWQEDTARKISWYCLQITVKESIWPLLSLGNTKDALRVYLSNIPPDLGLVLLEKIVKKSLFCRKKFSASQTLPPQTCMCYKDILGFIQLQFDKSLWRCWQQCPAEPFLRKFTVCMSVKGAAPNNGSIHKNFFLLDHHSRLRKRAVACA